MFFLFAGKRRRKGFFVHCQKSCCNIWSQAWSVFVATSVKFWTSQAVLFWFVILCTRLNTSIYCLFFTPLILLGFQVHAFFPGVCCGEGRSEWLKLRAGCVLNLLSRSWARSSAILRPLHRLADAFKTGEGRRGEQKVESDNKVFFENVPFCVFFFVVITAASCFRQCGADQARCPRGDPWLWLNVWWLCGRPLPSNYSPDFPVFQ